MRPAGCPGRMCTTTSTRKLISSSLRSHGGFDRRGLAARQGLARATGPREAFGNLLRAHVAFALEDGHLIGAMVTELGHLPDNVRRACVQEQRDYLDLWVRVLDAVRPGLDEAQARITISAAMTIVANAARTGRFRHRTDLADRLAEMCTALLLDTSSPDEVVAVAGTATTVAEGPAPRRAVPGPLVPVLVVAAVTGRVPVPGWSSIDACATGPPG